MALEFRNVSKRFPTHSGEELTAVKDVSFRVEEGEFVSVVGPSGCGKSTILSMTAGLYQPTEGAVLVSDEPVTGPNAHVGFMLQKDLLLPWRNIISNIEFGLEARGVGKAERRARAMQELKHCHLEGFDRQYPYQLSGGMRQRAALARTLAIDPATIKWIIKMMIEWAPTIIKLLMLVFAKAPTAAIVFAFCAGTLTASSCKGTKY